ncbi:MAG: ARPP-1 family domain-containing protein [Planctomycetota bacterium]|jgi:hypothetical protein
MKCNVLAGLMLALAACSDPPQVEDDLVRLDDHHTLGAPVAVSNLTVWPVFTDRPLEVGEFLTLPEALAKGVAEVRERDSAGQVDTLVLENKADLPILICAGTVVAGGKQDRQIGQDFVVQAKATSPIDAFCVEQGRWNASRGGLQTLGKFFVAEGVASRSVRSAGQYEKSQGKVWKEVAEVKKDAYDGLIGLHANPGAVTLRFSETSSYAVVMDASAKAAAPQLEEYTKAVRQHFAAQEECIGFAYAINGEPVTVRTFAHPCVFRQQFGPFLQTMAAEALLAAEGPAREARATDVVALVKGIADTREQMNETAGLNRNGIKATRAAFASSCYVERKGKGWVALTSDWTARR